MKVNGSKCRLMLALIKYAVIFVVVVLHVAFLFIVWTENGLLLNSCHIVDVVSGSLCTVYVGGTITDPAI